MIYVSFIRDCLHPSASLASAWETLCRLSVSGPWIWLVRSGALKETATIPLVLFHELPGFLVAFGEGALGHG